jgi:MFS transporter, putative metabolite:H+ symporter
MNNTVSTKTKWLVTVAALGYYVDAFDLILFGVIRKASLQSFGLAPEQILEQGQNLLNYQMIGMLIGGLFWGILGDKKGRIAVLFGSIIMYSVANLANAWVQSLEAYAFWRFVAGIGLAGELGVGITLVAESLPVNKRGIGTTIIACFGALGALSAPILVKSIGAETYFGLEAWRLAYTIGGLLGLALLSLRFGVLESSLYDHVPANTTKGNLKTIFGRKESLIKYLWCIVLGLPVWFIISIMAIIAPEIATALQVTGPVVAGDAIMYMYIGLAVGDFACGLLSQYFQSRKKPIYIYLGLAFSFLIFYLNATGISPNIFYALCAVLGIFTGYWALFITVASEQFGTNIRATVTTSVPNFVRGAVVPINLAFLAISKSMGLISAAYIVGAVCFTLALLANFFLKETFHKDLDYSE